MQAEVLLWEKLNEKTHSRATLGGRHSSAIGAPLPHLMPCYGLPIKPTGRMSRTISLHIHLYHVSSCGNGRYPVVSSLLISLAVWNWARIPASISHRAAAWVLLFLPRISSTRSDLHCTIRSCLLNWGYHSRMWWTVWFAQPQGQHGSIPGTPMAASHALSPITSVRSRNRAVASGFVRPSYRGSVDVSHGVLHIVSLWSFVSRPRGVGSAVATGTGRTRFH